MIARVRLQQSREALDPHAEDSHREVSAEREAD